jgi:hypothetical protein
MNMWLESTIVDTMQRRILILPIVWGVFGIGLVFGINYLLGPVVNDLPFGQNDKPIGGSYLPVTFFTTAAVLGFLALSLYALGIWNIDMSNRKTRVDLIALGILVGSWMGVFYAPLLLFPGAAALVYLLAVNID